APAWAVQLPARVAGAALVVAFALVTHASAAVWRGEVTAWARGGHGHPWSSAAFVLLGKARLADEDAAGAAAAYRHALELKADDADAHLALARLYYDYGDQTAADQHAHRFVELAPDSPEGPALLAAMRQ